MNKTLEQYLKENIDRNVIDFSIRASADASGVVTFYIHPNGVDGDTLDFAVDGNFLTVNLAVS